MNAYESLKNNYEVLVNNLKKSEFDINKYLKEFHTISESEYVGSYMSLDDDYKRVLEEESEKSVFAENNDFKKYEDWIMNGD